MSLLPTYTYVLIQITSSLAANSVSQPSSHSSLRVVGGRAQTSKFVLSWTPDSTREAEYVSKRTLDHIKDQSTGILTAGSWENLRHVPRIE